MPKTVRPNLPEDTDRAIEVLGNRVRVAILRSLLVTGTATRSQLSERLDLSMELLKNHLAILERLGAVELNPPRAQPGVRPRSYSADRAYVAGLVEGIRQAFED